MLHRFPLVPNNNYKSTYNVIRHKTDTKSLSFFWHFEIRSNYSFTNIGNVDKLPGFQGRVQKEYNACPVGSYMLAHMIKKNHFFLLQAWHISEIKCRDCQEVKKRSKKAIQICKYSNISRIQNLTNKSTGNQIMNKFFYNSYAIWGNMRL